MNRGIIILALVAFSACTVNADATDMMLTMVEHVQATAGQCLSTHGMKLDFGLLASFDTIGEAGKSLLACLFRALNIIDDNGTLNQEYLRSFIPADLPFKGTLETVITDCSKPQTNARDGSVNLVKCVFHEQVMKTAFGKMLNKARRMVNMFVK